MIQFVIDGLISMLDFAEEKLLFLNVILNSPPAEFVGLLLSITHFTIKHVASVLLSPILFAIEGFLTGIELALETVIFTINTTVNAIAYNPIGIIINLVSDFIERVRESAEEVKKPIISIVESSKSVLLNIKILRSNIEKGAI